MVDGSEIDPQEISLKIIEVKPNSFEAELFKWWNLVWWSMPYQHAYGRQMRLFCGTHTMMHVWSVSFTKPGSPIICKRQTLEPTSR